MLELKPKIKNNLKTLSKRFFVFPLYILSHPIDGFYEMKHGMKGSLRVATFFFFIYSILGIIEYAYTGFLFNNVDPNTFRLFKSLVLSILPFLVFIVANWSITSLMDGKGKMKEIYMVVGYAFFPSILIRIFNLFMSHYYTLDEAFFYHGAQTLAFVLVLLLIFMGIRSIHEYSLLRALVTVFLTLISMSILLFLGLLALSLAQQIIVFIQTIIKEITLRL
jgi:hypothetical protein